VILVVICGDFVSFIGYCLHVVRNFVFLPGDIMEFSCIGLVIVESSCWVIMIYSRWDNSLSSVLDVAEEG